MEGREAQKSGRQEAPGTVRPKRAGKGRPGQARQRRAGEIVGHCIIAGRAVCGQGQLVGARSSGRATIREIASRTRLPQGFGYSVVTPGEPCRDNAVTLKSWAAGLDVVEGLC